ncbi:MAG TPA: hypothetical protein HA348_04585 [Thermoplasmata archaeon]|nr:hypothetical protein [Thermoplasmata archaeon]
MMLEEEVEEIPEPKIKNRKELHQFLELRVNKTYELEKEYQRLEEELNMVKSYIIESHKPISELKADGYRINFSKTEDSTLFVVKFKRADMRKFSTLYVDTFDERFWTIHTVEKATIVDPFIDKIAKTEFKKDYVWFPSQYMERFKERGLLRSITLQYSELIGGDEEKSIGDLSMKLGGPASGEVLELFRNLPRVKSLILQTGDQRLSHILRVCEGLSHSSPLSGIGIEYTIHGDEISKFIRDDIIYKGKFTARGGNSVDGHLYLLRTAKEVYSTTIKYIEDEIAMGSAKVRPLRITGHPISIILTRSVEDLSAFSNEVISCKYPFRLWGIPRYESKDFVAITGVDLHTGSKLNIELSNDWIRLYLPRGSCGNTVARFYSIIQHNYDSNAKLEGVDYGELF